jgi:hypothetical protein
MPRITLKHLYEVIKEKDSQVREARDMYLNCFGSLGTVQQSLDRALAVIASQKQALRLAGETIKTIADAIPAK